jgi:N-acetyl-anhydromuramyl-L-alanine amidase AmpD
MPSLRIVTEGRSDLPGPLAQLCLGRDGTWFVVAAGRANHAGVGEWQGLTNGNASFIGVEAENTGVAQGPNADPWPDVQIDAYQRGAAAILRRLGADAIMCCGHKEYARPAGRKIDPTFDMGEFRGKVGMILAGTAPPPVLIPPADVTGRPTLRRGSRGDPVELLQAKLGVEADGIFGPNTEAVLRQFQRDHGLVPDGIAGPKTWAALQPA